MVEREAFGHDLGLNGYTTRRQAEALRSHLRVTPGDSVLEVGAGRGWPGCFVVGPTGGRLVSTDISREDLLEAKEQDAGDTAHEVAAADGRALPLRPQVFEGIIHADVFC